MKIIIDRLEEGIAVCENFETEEIINLPLHLLPPCKAGDCLKSTNGIWEQDLMQKADINKQTTRLINELFE